MGTLENIDGPGLNEERFCAYCGESFYAWHGLQKYCPEKNGKAYYCKNEHKKLLAEGKLVKKAEEYAKVLAYTMESAGLLKNRDILNTIMGGRNQKFVSESELDQAGFNIHFYDDRNLIPGTKRYVLTIGNYKVERKSMPDNLLTFNIYLK